MAGLPPRRWLVRGLLFVVVVALFAFSGVATLSYDEPTLRAGVTNTTPNGETVISSQGWHAQGLSLSNRPAQLVAVNRSGDVDWIYNGSENTTNWFYDVDPLPNGNLLVVNPVENETVVYEFDPDRQKRVWTEHLDSPDIHDIDLINGDELLVAGIRLRHRRDQQRQRLHLQSDHPECDVALAVQEPLPGERSEGYRREGLDPRQRRRRDRRKGEFLVSARNMDQVIAINRSTKAIDMRLGSDDDYATLYEQHNPTYLESENGTPTILVADSENDRVVEYERTGGPAGSGTWRRTWTLSGDLNWPRDADRLANGNTLVVDSMNNRVIEVTPSGRSSGRCTRRGRPTTPNAWPRATKPVVRRSPTRTPPGTPRSTAGATRRATCPPCRRSSAAWSVRRHSPPNSPNSRRAGNTSHRGSNPSGSRPGPSQSSESGFS